MEPKEQLILDNAKELFIRYGFKKTSVDEIAEAAGIGKGTIYNYFKNKEDLFVRCTQSTQEEMLRDMEQELSQLQRADEKLVHIVLFIVRFIGNMSKEFGMSKKVMEELLFVGMNLYGDLPGHREKTLFLMQEGADQGIFKSGNHAKNAALLDQTARMYYLRWALMDIQEAEEEIRDLYELIFNGLRR